MNRVLPVVNVCGSPVVGSGPSGSWDELSSGGIKEFEQPGSSSRNSSVHLDGEGSSKLKVLPVDGSLEVNDSNVSVVGWVGLSVEGNV